MDQFIRFSLGILLAILALNAFEGGYYAMAGAKDVPIDLLARSPLKNYFIPGLFLFVIIGGSALYASIAVFRRLPGVKKAAFASAVIVMLWLAIQVAIIGYLSWMQPVTAGVALIILLLTWKLPRYAN